MLPSTRNSREVDATRGRELISSGRAPLVLLVAYYYRQGKARQGNTVLVPCKQISRCQSPDGFSTSVCTFTLLHYIAQYITDTQETYKNEMAKLMTKTQYTCRKKTETTKTVDCGIS